MARAHLITIHGISPSNWQDEVETAFWPHFTCHAARYPHYPRPWGALNLVLEPWALAAGALLALFFALRGIPPWIGWAGGAVFAFIVATKLVRAAVAWARMPLLLLAVPACLFLLSLVSDRTGFPWLGFVLGILGLAHLLSPTRRWRALKKVKRSCSDGIPAGAAPAVIAHSLGTHLFGDMVRRFPDTCFSRVVLAGSVLPEAFAWADVLETRAAITGPVRNEVGARDWVAELAYRSRGIISGLGRAGRVGFAESDLVHYADNVHGECRKCGENPLGLVHNVKLDKATHNDQFIDAGHARRYWLPFLWGYEPGDFDEWVKYCHEADNIVEQKWPREKQAILEQEFLERHWSWTRGPRMPGARSKPGSAIPLEQFEQYLKKLVADHLVDPLPDEDLEDVLGDAVRFIWRAIADADNEMADGRRRDERTARAFNPPVACEKAVRTAIEGYKP